MHLIGTQNLGADFWFPVFLFFNLLFFKSQVISWFCQFLFTFLSKIPSFPSKFVTSETPLSFSDCPSATSKSWTLIWSTPSDTFSSFSISPSHQSQLPYVTQVSYASNVCLPFSSLLFLFFPIAKASRPVGPFCLPVPSSLLLFQPSRFKKFHLTFLWSCPWVKHVVEPDDFWRSAPTCFFFCDSSTQSHFFSGSSRYFLVYQTLQVSECLFVAVLICCCLIP